MTPRRVLIAAWFPGAMRAVAPLAATFRVRGWMPQVLATTISVGVAERYRPAADHVTVIETNDEAGALQLLRTAPPEVLVIGIGEGLPAERALVAEARQRLIPSLGVLDTWGDHEARLAGPDQPAVLAVANSALKRELDQAGIGSSAEIVVSGHPGLEEFLTLDAGRPAQQRARAGLALPANSEVVTFFSQPIEQHFGRSLGYTQFDAVRAIADALPLSVELMVAVHPRDDGQALRRAAGSRAHFRDNYDPAVVCVASDVVASCFSATLVEAALARRPVVSAQPGLQTADRCWANRLGITERASTFDEIADALTRARALASLPEELERRRAMVDLPPGSIDRLVALADSLAAKKSAIHPTLERA